MRILSAIWLILATSGCVASRTGTRPRAVKTGVDVLVAEGFKPVAGKRIGLITNPTGVTSDLRSTIDVLHGAASVELVALFGPEHGVRGDAHAGDVVADARDAKTGLPVHSLYGATRKPTPEALEGIDALVFDLQDTGSRSYTFISTMALAMEAAAEQNIAFIVLDRPNPLTGERIEGRPLDLNFRSFVGHLPIPYVHGMTVGELARMINGEGWLSGGIKCDLHVVPMSGWKRRMHFGDTGLTWVPTSPHVPRSDSALFYAVTGIMGELHVVSEGVGYTLPFELAAAPGIDAERMAEALNERKLAGMHFRPTHYRPYYASYKDENCAGVQIHLLDRTAAHLTSVQFHVMDIVRSQYGHLQLFGNGRDGMFDKVCGTDGVRKMFLAGEPIEKIIGFWNEGVEEFRARRTKYLLYE